MDERDTCISSGESNGADAEADAHVCKWLRTKMYYVLGRDHVDLRVPSPTAQYWCAKTAVVLGPDDVYCSPRVCQPGRACFVEEE